MSTATATVEARGVGRAWARPLRSVPIALPYIWLGIVGVGGLAGILFLGDTANAPSTAVLQGPSLAHPFGTDELGRDILSRTLVGASVSMRVGGLAVLIGLIVGGAVGTAAAISGRIVDEILMRLMDIILSFPAIVLALLVATLVGGSMIWVAVIIGIVITPQIARLVRSRLMLEMREGYVVAERSAGASTLHILLRHVVRNIVPPVAAYCLLMLADACLFEAALSFIGVGIQPPQASWGNMILGGQKLLLAGNWWVSVFPGIMLFLTVASLNTLADRTVGIADEAIQGGRR